VKAPLAFNSWTSSSYEVKKKWFPNLLSNWVNLWCRYAEEYAFDEYRRNDLIRLDVMINGEIAEPLACICHRDKSYNMGRGLVDALKVGGYIPLFW
jgi:hypothetical protein